MRTGTPRLPLESVAAARGGDPARRDRQRALTPDRDVVAALVLVALLSWLLPTAARAVRSRWVPATPVVWSDPDAAGAMYWSAPARIASSPQRQLRHLAADGTPMFSPGGWPGLLLGHRLDINHATLDDLQALPGVGPKLAQTILDHRLRCGPFASVAQMQQVRGIGPKTLRRLSPMLTVGLPLR